MKLVLYDGECGMCDRLVQWLLRHDHRNILQYAPLQGETAKPFVQQRASRSPQARGSASPRSARLADGPIDTMIFVERDGDQTRIFERSRGALRILRHLGGFWRVLSWARVLPLFLTDAIYNFVARNRIRWFGRVESCRVPDAETKLRFLP